MLVTGKQVPELVERTEIHSSRSKSRTALWAVAGCLLIFLLASLVAAIRFRHHAEPILRAKVIESLSTRFNSRVELGEFHVDILNGLEVRGSDVKLFPRNFEVNQPL